MYCLQHDACLTLFHKAKVTGKGFDILPGGVKETSEGRKEADLC